MNAETYKIFISCVSSEFGQHREQLRSQLKTAYRDVHIQEDFSPAGVDALLKIDDYIRASDKILHIVGEREGSIPDQDAVGKLLAKRPDFARFVPAIANLAPDFDGISYTQWEAWIALYHGRELLTFRAVQHSSNDALKLHVERLRASGRPPSTFETVDGLINIVMRSEAHRQEVLRSQIDNVVPLRLDGFDETVGARLEKRKDVLGKAANWRFLRERRYAPRPELIAGIFKDFNVWWDEKAAAEQDDFHVFWLDGRSGDGKSVALLQLVEEFLLARPNMIAVKVDVLQRLPEAMQWLSGSYAGRGIIVVDDLHRLAAEDQIISAMRGHIEQGYPAIPILTCGPTPERIDFAERHRDGFKIRPEAIRGATTAERVSFRAWLGAPPPENEIEDQILVELLFELDVGQSIKEFATNFRRRLRSANTALEEEVLNILAVNALDQPAHPSLITGSRAQAFVDRLGREDQRHFDGNAAFDDGSPAIRFSHTRIAWRLFEAWSADALTGRDIGLRMADALLPSFMIQGGPKSLLKGIVGAIFSRWPSLHSCHPDQSMNLLEAIAARLQARRADVAQTLHTVFTRLNALNQTSVSVGILNCARQRLTSDGPDQRWATGLAASWLPLWVSHNPNDTAPAYTLVRSILFDSARSDDAAMPLIFLASNKVTAAAWKDEPKQWLELHGERPGAHAAYVWLLSRDKSADVQSMALKWIDANPLSVGTTTVLVSLLTAYGQTPELRGRALAWLDENQSTQGAHHVIATLLAKYGQAPDVMRRALTWLDANQGTPGAHQVIASLLAKHGQEPDVMRRALDWLDANQGTPGAHQVIASLLAKHGQEPDVMRRALTWLDTSHGTQGAHQIIATLLTKHGQDPDIIRRALDWLDANQDTPGANDVITSLLTKHGQDPNIIRRALAWLDANQGTPGAHQVIASLLTKHGQDPDIIRRALEWLDANQGTPGAHQVIASLLTKHGQDPVIMQRALAWLETQNKTPQIIYELLVAYATAGVSRSIIEFELAKLDNDTKAIRYRSERLASALRTTTSPDGLIELILLLKERAQSDRQMVTLRRIANIAAASAADVVIDAAIRSPDKARDLLFLIAGGTALAENSGAEVLARKQQWPRAHMGYFWTAIISARDLDTKTLVADLAVAIGSPQNPNRSIMSALARRTDFEAVFAPHLPHWVQQVVAVQRLNATR